MIGLYLVVGIINPDSNIHLERWIRRIFKKPPIIIIDSTYIQKRNIKLYIRILLPMTVFIIVISIILGFL